MIPTHELNTPPCSSISINTTRRSPNSIARPATRPEDLGTLKLRSDIYWKQKRFADAVPVLQKAAELAPSDADISARLGEVYLQKKDYPNAVHWLAAAYNMNPKANDVLADLVDAEFESKNYAAGARRPRRSRQAPGAAAYQLVCPRRLLR